MVDRVKLLLRAMAAVAVVGERQAVDGVIIESHWRRASVIGPAIQIPILDLLMGFFEIKEIN